MNPKHAGSRGRASARPLAACFAAALLYALLLPQGALGHAVLRHTEPHQSSSVKAAPGAVELEFNEPVEASFGAIRVFDSRGERVDRGDITQPGGRQDHVGVALREGLPRGVYTATYRVVSADGHPVSGGFAFGIGTAVPAGKSRGAPDVAKLLERSGAGPAVEGLYGAARGLHYAALLLLVGALAFALLVWPRGSARRWPSRLLAAAALVGLLTALAGILFQGALGAGASIGSMFDGDVIDGSLSTRTGDAWLVRSCAWATVLAFVLFRRCRPGRVGAVVLALPVAVLVGTLPWAGHPATQSPTGVLVPADVLHVLAAGSWLGGLLLLLAVFWPRAGAEPHPDAAEATARFSRIALPAVVLLVVAGTAQAWFELGSVGALFDSTYGLALLAKIVLIGGVVGLGAGNRKRVAKLASGGVRTAQALKRSMSAEVVLAVLVLSATATLVRAAPPSNQGPVVRDLDVGPLRLQMDIEPARVGPNDYHLYFFDRRSGAQVDRVKEVTVQLRQRDKGIGPITLKVPREGPAHYELLSRPLGVPGHWDARVLVRVSEFDEYSASTDFDIR